MELKYISTVPQVRQSSTFFCTARSSEGVARPVTTKNGEIRFKRGSTRKNKDRFRKTIASVAFVDN